MKQFMDKDFLLSNETAKVLYHDYAAKMPILDYHCHINPQEIFEDRKFENITQVWLGGDHYKWRVMRGNGVEEKYITGDASDREKFQKFAEALPKCIGNPMYHWCHLELQRYFGYYGVLNGETAEEVWNLANDKLRNDPTMTVRGLVKQSNVYMVGTTDDPVDSLEWHAKLAADPTMETKVCPSFRPDKAVNIHKAGWKAYLGLLAASVGKDTLATMQDILDALTERLDYFYARGCKVSDHGLDYVPFDGYRAILHKGERVETASEASMRRAYAMQAPSFDMGSVLGRLGGDVYLDGRIVGQVMSAQQARQYKNLNRSGWRA